MLDRCHPEKSEMRKHFFLICLIVFPLSSFVVASAQINPSTDVPQQADESGQNSDPGTTVDTASAPVSTPPASPAGKAPTPAGTSPSKTSTSGYTFPSG